jgi:hypothetical protein
MKQPIAGLAPSELGEAAVTTVWPSIVSFPTGRFLGRLYMIQWPGVYFFRLGNLIALLSIPHALLLFFMGIGPGIGKRYTLTNRRVVVKRGISGVDSKSIELSRFNEIDIDVKKGDEWFHAGDLVFKQDGVEKFRLEGVSRPEAFRKTCLNSQRSYVGVQAALAAEASMA